MTGEKYLSRNLSKYWMFRTPLVIKEWRNFSTPSVEICNFLNPPQAGLPKFATPPHLSTTPYCWIKNDQPLGVESLHPLSWYSNLTVCFKVIVYLQQVSVLIYLFTYLCVYNWWCRKLWEDKMNSRSLGI